jgi:glycine oxidase
VIGLMTGWTLARAGARTTVIDSGGPAATNAAAGMLAPSFEKTLHKSGDALAAFSAASLHEWRRASGLLQERSGLSIDFDGGGILSAIFDDADQAAFERDHEGGERLSRQEALGLEPALSPAVIGAWRAGNDGQVDPRKALKALKAAFLNDGGQMRAGRRVAGLLSHGGAIAGVILSSGARHAAGAVVIATGARIDGLSPLPAGAVFPVKGEALALVKVEGAPRHVVRTSRAYLCPKSDGRVVIGATEVAGDWSLNTDSARVSALREGAIAAFPALKDAGEIERWAGLRPATRDGAPILGAAPDGPKGLFYALGHYRNGVLLAPATATAIADLILNGGPQPDVAFSAARFNELGVS